MEFSWETSESEFGQINGGGKGGGGSRECETDLILLEEFVNTEYLPKFLIH